MNYLAAFLLLALQLSDADPGSTAASGVENCAPASALKDSDEPAQSADAAGFHLGAGHVTPAAVEADAFWLLGSLLARFEGYFSDGFPTLLRDTELLGALLSHGPQGHASSSSSSGGRQQQPSLALHLEACGFDLLMYTPKWLICLYLNTLPGHVAVRVWDLALWHGGAAATPATAHAPVAADGAADAQATDDGAEEAAAEVRDGGHGVLLWVSLGVLRGLGPALRQCSDFEGVDVCLKTGLDTTVRAFGWLQRHSGSSLIDVVAVVRAQCAARRAADRAGHRYTFLLPPPPPPPQTTATAAAAALAGLEDTSLRARATAASNSNDGAASPAWYLRCDSERALVVGLATAKATAGELRLADDQWRNNSSGGSSSTASNSSSPSRNAAEATLSATSVAALVSSLGLARRPLPDALRALLAKRPLPEAVAVAVGAEDQGGGGGTLGGRRGSEARVFRPAGAAQGAAALALLRAFAMAYAHQQRQDPAAARVAARAAQEQHALQNPSGAAGGQVCLCESEWV
jgi:hypothetical protein